LGEEAIPKVNGKVFVSAAETGNEVIFEGAHGMFSSIASVDVGWY